MSGPDLIPCPPVWADVQLEAREALTAIEALLTAGTEHANPAPSERVYVASQLLRASSDHAHAIALILLTEPLDFGAVALTLHRSQLEQFCRGMFFGKAATDAEVDYYLRNDDSRPILVSMGRRNGSPSRRWRRGQKRTLVYIPQLRGGRSPRSSHPDRLGPAVRDGPRRPRPAGVLPGAGRRHRRQGAHPNASAGRRAGTVIVPVAAKLRSLYACRTLPQHLQDASLC